MTLAKTATTDSGIDVKAELLTVEQVSRAMERANGNVELAAASLGRHSRTLKQFIVQNPELAQWRPPEAPVEVLPAVQPKALPAVSQEDGDFAAHLQELGLGQDLIQHAVALRDLSRASVADTQHMLHATTVEVALKLMAERDRKAKLLDTLATALDQVDTYPLASEARERLAREHAAVSEQLRDIDAALTDANRTARSSLVVTFESMKKKEAKPKRMAYQEGE